MSISMSSVFAQGDYDVTFDIVTENEKVYRGDTVTMTVSAAIAADTDIQGIQADFLQNGFGDITGLSAEISENTLGWTSVGLTKNNLLGYGNVNEEGGILKGTFEFTVPEDAEFGTTYTLTIEDAVVAPEEASYTISNGTVSVEVIDFPEIEGVSISGYEGVYDGENHTLDVEIPSGATITYSTDDIEYAEDLPEYRNVGEYTVYYKVNMDRHKEKSGSCKVKISAKELSESMIETITAQEYTGEQIKPDIVVKDGEPSIITGDDYTISYGENINVATGGSVSLEGKGNYKGTAVKNFEISPITMSADETDYDGIYDGVPHSAKVEVLIPNNANLKYGLVDGNYDLEQMPEFTDAGEYTIYYKAIADNYNDLTGSVSVSIEPKEITDGMVSDLNDCTYTGEQMKPDVTVIDGEPSTITSDDYTITYGENINVATGGSVSVEGKNNYKGKVIKNFSITPAQMDVQTENYSGIYDGTNHTGKIKVNSPEGVEIKYGTTSGVYDLVEMPEYKNYGAYTVYFRATKENYVAVENSVTVEVQKKTLTDSMVDNITAQEYTGQQIKPDIVVKDGEPSIITVDDYTVEYGENINVATGGTVKIIGKGNYQGEITKNFEISNVILKAQTQDYEGIYDGKPHKASLEITNNSNADVVYGLTNGEYNLSEMPEYTDAGNYTIYYKATADNYSDCIGSVSVKIDPKPLTENMISNINEHTYIGKKITPDVSITDGEPSIISETDYDISYGENINVSDGGSVVITAKRNYSGTVTKTFAIKKAELKISAENKTVTYGETFEIVLNYDGFKETETKDVLKSAVVVGGFTNKPDAGVYDITLSGADADNYSIIYEGTPKLTVNKKPISVTDLKVFDKLYDGNKTAQINDSTVVFDGIIDGDIVILDISGATAEFVSAEIGENITVNITGLGIKGESSKNYTLINSEIPTVANIRETVTAASIAEQIIALAIDKNEKTLKLPTVPDGYKVSLKSSSDETIVALDGKITLSDMDKFVDLIFTVSNTDGTDKADTNAINVKVPAADKYTVTVSADENGTVTGGGEFIIGTEVTVNAVANSGYAFKGWYSGETAISTTASYTFTLNNDVALTAKFEVKSSGSSGGGGGGGGAASTPKDNGTVTEGKLEVSATIKDGTAKADISTKQVTSMIDSAKKSNEQKVTIVPKTDDTAKTVKVNIPTSSVKDIINNGISSLDIRYNIAEVSIPKNVLKPLIDSTDAKNITFDITAKTPDEVKDSKIDLDKASIVEFNVKAQEKNIEGIEWKNMKFNVSVDNDFEAGKEYKVVNILEDGTKTFLTGKCEQEGDKLVVKVTGAEQGIIAVTDKFKMDFNDIDNHWASDAIEYVYNNEIMFGTSDKEFSPNSKLTRAMLVTIVYRAEGEPDTSATNKFTDVPGDEYYTKAVAWASENGIVSGYSAQKFGPNDDVTREQIATIIQRYALYRSGADNVQLDELNYADATDISEWAEEAIKYCAKVGLMIGNEKNEFNPLDGTTRAETATILERFLELIE